MPPCIQFEDLVSWGIEGLIKAYKNFKTNKGSQFNTYAYYRIRGEIMDRIRKEWQYRNPTEFSEYRKRVQKRIADLAEDYTEEKQRSANPKKDLLEKVTHSYLITTDQIDLISDKAGTKNPEEEYIQDESVKTETSIIAEEIGELPKDEQRIIELFYKHGLKQKEIAEELKYSKSKICRIHMKVLDKLKRRLERRFEQLNQ